MREHLTFTTEQGSVFFGGDKYIITNIDGINRPEIKRQEVFPIDTDGKRIARTTYTTKTVTVNGYIRASNKPELFALKLELVRLLDCKTDGRLIYEVDSKRYFTEAIPADTPVFGDIVQNFIPFTVMFEAYNVYWKAFKKTETDVYERIAGIPEEDGTFAFPCIFSFRENKKNFYNKGNLPADFVCTIQGTSETGELGVATLSETRNAGFMLMNNLSGEYMIINHDVAVGETVTIDTADFSIISNIYGNILHKLENGTDFFKLSPGRSEIEVTNYNAKNNVLVTFGFHETYREV